MEPKQRTQKSQPTCDTVTFHHSYCWISWTPKFQLGAKSRDHKGQEKMPTAPSKQGHPGPFRQTRKLSRKLWFQKTDLCPIMAPRALGILGKWGKLKGSRAQERRLMAHGAEGFNMETWGLAIRSSSAYLTLRSVSEHIYHHFPYYFNELRSQRTFIKCYY